MELTVLTPINRLRPLGHEMGSKVFEMKGTRPYNGEQGLNLAHFVHVPYEHTKFETLGLV